MRRKPIILLSAFICLWPPLQITAENEALMLQPSEKSYVEIPFFPTPEEMTIEAWIRTRQNSTGTIVAWKDKAGDGESSMFRVQNGKLQYGEWYRSTWKELNSSQSVCTGIWTHVALVRKGSEARLYINGVESDSSTMNTTAACTTDNLRIGVLAEVWSECFDGNIDEVRIWSVARTADEIKQNFNRELDGTETALEGYWKFDGNTIDSSSKNRDGKASDGVGYVTSDIFVETAPEVSGLAFSESTERLPALTVETSRSGEILWAILPETEPAPSAEELRDGSDRLTLTGKQEVSLGGEHTLPFTGRLSIGKNYVVYAVLATSDGNSSPVKASVPFTYKGLSCLPETWSYTDIGNVASAGMSKAHDGVFTLTGSGTDIWAASDGFHFAYCPLEGDTEVVARITDIEADDNWAKVGLMIRTDLTASSPHVFICTTPGEGANQFVRRVAGATTTCSTVTPSQPWLKLVKKGKWIATYCSADGEDWTKVGMNVELRDETFAYVGLAICSHGSGTATATVDNVALATPDETLNLSDRGVYFDKKVYVPEPIPQFKDIRDQLPRPVLTDNPEWEEMYYKAWEIGFGHIKSPVAGSPLVSNFYDEAFGNDIFQWDMIFMTVFGRYAEHIFPGIESLDNFYCRQHESGCITRCVSEDYGEDNGDEDSDNIINPPLFSWAEMLNYKFTADTARLRRVFPVLEKYEAFVELKRNGNDTPHKLYWNNGQASGMDNLPRDIGRENLHHASDHQGWTDMSSQVVIQCQNLAEMCDVLAAAETDSEKKNGYEQKAIYYKQKADAISQRMNRWLWDETDRIYYDVDTAGVQTGWKTAACFWPMLAGVTDARKDSCLVHHLQDPASFWRDNVFPALAADEEGYSPRGGYWCGGVWAPSNYAIIKGLERKGIDDFAHLASMRYLNAVYDVFEQTGTFWENYAPELKNGRFNHGTDESDIDPCRRDFIGWTGLAPISILIENILGFRVDAPANTVTFDMRRLDRHGIEKLHFAGTTTSIIAAARNDSEDDVELAVTPDKPYTLIVRHGEQTTRIDVPAGNSTFELKNEATGIENASAEPLKTAVVTYDAATHLLTVDAVPPFGVSLYDMACSRVRTWHVGSRTDGLSHFSCEGFPKGVYIVNVTSSDTDYSCKLLVE